MKASIISVTLQGDVIASKIQKNMDADLFSKKKSELFNLNSITQYCMENYKAVIFIASTGIAVRAIAPFIKRKDLDPAVIVIDCSAKFVISLLSGHLGGANALAVNIASMIKALPIITTASDNLGFISPDMIAKDNNLEIDDLTKCKNIASMLIEGKQIGFIDDENKIKCPKGYVNVSSIQKGLTAGVVYVTNKENIDQLDGSINKSLVLKLIRKDIILGVGCRKNYDPDVMLKQVQEVLIEKNIDIRSVRCISTVELKKDEIAINMLSKTLNCGIDIWQIDDIKKVQAKYKGSDFVEKTIGARAVCEPCTELSGGKLLTQKICINGMTLCVGQYYYFTGDDKIELI